MNPVQLQKSHKSYKYLGKKEGKSSLNAVKFTKHDTVVL
jgi:hypothetical protein